MLFHCSDSSFQTKAFTNVTIISFHILTHHSHQIYLIWCHTNRGRCTHNNVQVIRSMPYDGTFSSQTKFKANARFPVIKLDTLAGTGQYT